MRLKNSRKTIQCYCAFCKLPKKVYPKSGLGKLRILFCFLVSMPVSYVIWGEINPSLLFICALFIAMAEGFLQLRRRVSIVCRHCGFDPLVYVQSPPMAAAKVKAHLEKRKNNPASILGPALNLPRRKKPVPVRNTATMAPARSGSLLSKRT